MSQVPELGLTWLLLRFESQDVDGHLDLPAGHHYEGVGQGPAVNAAQIYEVDQLGLLEGVGQEQADEAGLHEGVGDWQTVEAGYIIKGSGKQFSGTGLGAVCLGW